MKPFLKVGVVAGGYMAALIVASAAVGIRLASTSGPDAQASSGMYAFGDALLFVAVFGVAALVPTGAALFFLRPYRHFWTVLSAFGLGIAVTGLAAAILFAIGRHAAPSPIATWAGLSVLRVSWPRHSSRSRLSCAQCSRGTDFLAGHSSRRLLWRRR
jgi:hypothetical protein